MKKWSIAAACVGVSALLVFLASWGYLAYEIFVRGTDPDRMLPAAYVMAGAFLVLVPCLLYRIYVKFDRKYRSENKSDKMEEKK